MTAVEHSEVSWIKQAIQRSAAVIEGLGVQTQRLEAMSATLIGALRTGHKALAAGNGGSAAEALHFVEELVGRYKSNRPALPALALAADPTVLTCIGNDFGYNCVFSRQIEAHGQPGDILLLLSTSGHSPNLAAALDAAQVRKLTTLCLLGRDGGALAGRADHELIVDAVETEHIQEAHQVIVHLLLEAVERAFAEVPR